VNSSWPHLLERRELLVELVWSDLRAQVVRRRLGALWWVADPLLMMVVYWGVVVGLLGRGKTAYAPYPVYLLCALVTWKHLAKAAQRATGILRQRESLIRSVPFPTAVLPVAEAASGLVLSLGGYLVVAVASLLFPSPHHGGSLLPWVQVPLLLAFQLVAVTGICLLLACAGTLARDLEAVTSHLIRIGFYVSPGLFGLDLVRDELFTRLGPEAGAAALFGYLLNPFAILFTGYRDAFFYGRFLPLEHWLLLAGSSLGLLAVGYGVYRRHDDELVKRL